MRKYKLEPYRIIYNAEIKLVSPLIIGSGIDENSNNDVMKDKKGNPFVPATSFAGILKHHFEDNYKKANCWEKLFGFSENYADENGSGSKIIFSNLILKSAGADIRIRDGIRIDNKTGITEDAAKFDYEVVEPDINFSFKIEIQSDEENFIKSFVKTLERDIKIGEISLGAKTKSGFGRIEFLSSKTDFYNLNEKEDILKWISRNENLINLDEISLLISNSKNLIINFDFFIKDSLIVKHYSEDPKSVDSEHIKSNGKNIIPGTSIKGAIRARAERIVKTLGVDDDGKFLLFLFGNSMKDFNKDKPEKESKKDKGSIPSRLSINEVRIEQKVKPSIQQRIKINRFTGGTIDGALFESMPIFAENEIKSNRMQIKIENPVDAEIGLLLLILKDFWTGDLPIGGEKNVGRGVLKGLKIEILQVDNRIEIDDFLKLSEENANKLQKYVSILNEADFENHIKYYEGIYEEILNERE